MSDRIKLLKNLNFLEKHALKEHYILIKEIGVSHGDPGGWPFVKEHCAALFFDRTKFAQTKPEFIYEPKCDCGAVIHNLGVKNMAEEIRQQL